MPPKKDAAKEAKEEETVEARIVGPGMFFAGNRGGREGGCWQDC
jgi:hypothetical protein